MRSKQTKKKPSERNDQLLRVLDLIDYLDKIGGRDVQELSQHFGRSIKTIRRDLNALEAVGIPLETALQGKRKTWQLGTHARLDKLKSLFSANHFLALRVAMEPGVALSNESPLFAILEDLAQKLEQAIGPGEKTRLAAIDQAFYPYEKRAYRRLPPDVLWPLVHAIGDHRLCRVTYRAPGQPAEGKTYSILPLRIFAFDGSLYLMCHEPKHGRILKLNLQRLRSIQVLKRRGTVPRDFDPEQVEEAAFALVAGGPPTDYLLRFDAEVADFIRERVWHPKQTLTDLPDGSVELAFRCDASYEIGAWVQSWGRAIKVLAPATLRREQREIGEWLTATYGKPRRTPRNRNARGTR